MSLEKADRLAKELGFESLDVSEHEKLPIPYMREGIRNYANGGFYLTVDGKRITNNGQTSVELGGHLFVGHAEYGFVDSLLITKDFDELKRELETGLSHGYIDLVERRKASKV